MMERRKSDRPAVYTYADHEIIKPMNKLAKAIARVSLPDDDPVARAEAAIAQLSSEFSDWMSAECERLHAARCALKERGFSKESVSELFHAAHDIRGDAATLGYAHTAPIAESLCRIIDYAPAHDRIPLTLVDQHVDAIRAIVREYARPDIADVVRALSARLLQVTQDYLIRENRHRPNILEGVF